MNIPPYSPLASHWKLNRQTTFLNHGSFGACPTPILDKQLSLRLQMEEDPVKFMVNNLEDLMWESKNSLAKFTGCKAENIVFTSNATSSVNFVMQSLVFQAGDEILTHNHIYGACLNTLKAKAAASKARLVICDIPFPLNNEEEIIRAFLNSVTPKTKFALIDYITSATGIIFPVNKLTRALQEKGVQVMIDGAHAPGMVQLNIQETGAEYFGGNCHKWICTPKGSAFLYVREDMQKNIHPLIISQTYDKPVGSKRWSGQFMWTGTSDYTPWLCIPEAIDFMGSLMGSWEKLREYNRNLVLLGRNLVLQKLNAFAPSPDSMIGSLSTIQLPIPYKQPEYSFNYTHPVGTLLYSKYGIQIPIHMWPEKDTKVWIRISAQAYNSPEQMQYLAGAIEEIFRDSKI